MSWTGPAAPPRLSSPSGRSSWRSSSRRRSSWGGSRGSRARWPGRSRETVRETAAAVSEGLAKLAAAIRTRTITTTFASTATEIRGTKRLQVAELSQVEVVERRDATELFGVSAPRRRRLGPGAGHVHLRPRPRRDVGLRPDGTDGHRPRPRTRVERAGRRRLEADDRDGGELDPQGRGAASSRSCAPPSPGSSAQRARQNVPLVRETARRQAEEFVRAWLLRAYGVPEDVRVVVRFRGEPETIEARPAAPRLSPGSPQRGHTPTGSGLDFLFCTDGREIVLRLRTARARARAPRAARRGRRAPSTRRSSSGRAPSSRRPSPCRSAR